ncbi:MAG TPA: efflux RND transporter periplasmic adaptor subunit [Casimicrobiaceae bacterium]
MLLVLMLPACVTACGKSASESTAPAPPPLAVKVVEVAPRSVPIAFDVVGQTEGAKEVEVRARVAGILLKQLYHEGDTVRAGAPLFEIDPATYEVALKEANAALAQERARLAQATRDEARFRDLVADRAVSQKDYDDALSQKQLSDATVQQAAAKVDEARLNLSYTAVNAPVGGISGRAQQSVGSLITTDANGSLLTTINQVNPIWVRFSLAESDLAKLPGGKLARTGAVVEIALADGTRYPDKGKLNFAATEIDTRLGTQQLRAEFDNKREDLVPGQFVRVHLIAGRRDNVFLVPQAAVMQTENGYFVFVVGSDRKAMARTVQTGAWIGSDWTILAGLESGDRVIVDNLLKVRPGLVVTPTLQQDSTNAAIPGAAGAPAPAR